MLYQKCHTCNNSESKDIDFVTTKSMDEQFCNFTKQDAATGLGETNCIDFFVDVFFVDVANLISFSEMQTLFTVS